MTKYVHYTTLQNLHSILATKELWATSIRYLNDQRELEDALDLVAEAVPKANKIPGVESFIEQLNLVKADVASTAAQSLFVLSFSQNDLLSQWRGYSPNNDGYALEIDLDAILPRDAISRVVDCVYDRSAKATLIRDFLNKYFAEYRGSPKPKTKSEFRAFITERLMELAAHFKDQAFEEERERRITIMKPLATETRYRAGRHHLIPYVAIRCELKHIKSITVGPTRHQDLAIAGLRSLLTDLHGQYHRENGHDLIFDEQYPVPSVTPSKIPYRV